MSEMSERKHRERKRRIARMLRVLKTMYREPQTELRYRTHFELLVAVILSAQCTDKRVNEVTKTLFRKYKTLDDYIHADPRIFENDIRPTGFYRNKTKNILAGARVVKDTFHGILPKGMDDMLTIPGVGRKTANVVLGNAYGIYPGIAVDTHVRRLALKFDLTDHRDPARIEQDLMDLVPEKDWKWVNNHLVLYGRYVCKAHKHDCTEHPLTRLYPKANMRWPLSRGRPARH